MIWYIKTFLNIKLIQIDFERKLSHNWKLILKSKRKVSKQDEMTIH